MKKFEMPIVSVNEMAMNESIASECCFALLQDRLNITSKVLNGGELANRTITRWHNNVRGLTADQRFTALIQPSVHYYRYVYAANSTSAIQGGDVASNGFFSDQIEWWWNPAIRPDGRVNEPLTTAVWTNFNTTGFCDHLSRGSFNCPWLTTETIDNMHVGATVRHSMGGVNWSADHRSFQFNS